MPAKNRWSLRRSCIAAMQNQNTINLLVCENRLGEILDRQEDIVAAYLHGSVLSTETPGDIDVAIYVTPERFKELELKGAGLFDYVFPLELKLEKELGYPVDIQLLNKAPLPFRYSVVNRSVVLIDRNPSFREEFELLTRLEYFDFRPRIEEYLKGIAA
jgi:uncharacterized protein